MNYSKGLRHQKTVIFTLYAIFLTGYLPAHLYKDAAGFLWIGIAGSINLYRFDPVNRQIYP